jgi:hypothetical protein
MQRGRVFQIAFNRPTPKPTIEPDTAPDQDEPLDDLRGPYLLPKRFRAR